MSDNSIQIVRNAVQGMNSRSWFGKCQECTKVISKQKAAILKNPKHETILIT